MRQRRSLLPSDLSANKLRASRFSFARCPRLDGRHPLAHPAKLVGTSVEPLIKRKHGGLVHTMQITITAFAHVSFGGQTLRHLIELTLHRGIDAFDDADRKCGWSTQMAFQAIKTVRERIQASEDRRQWICARGPGILHRDGLKRVQALMKLEQMLDQLDQPFLDAKNVIGRAHQLDDGAHDDAALSATIRLRKEE